MAPHCQICKCFIKPRQHSYVCIACKSATHRICLPKTNSSTFYNTKLTFECEICINAKSTPNLQHCATCNSSLTQGTICFICHFPSIEVHDILDPYESDFTSFNLDLLFLENSLPTFTKGIKIGHHNINGLFSKVHELKNFLLNNHFDYFACSESKLNSSHTNSLLEIDGYDFVRLDRTQNQGGGTCIYIKNSHMHHEIHFEVKFPTFVEVIPIKIYPKFRKPFICISIYKPPNIPFSQFSEPFEALLFHLNQLETPYFILGDFNVNLLDKASCDTNNLCNMTKQYSLAQHISNPTRITQNSCTLIDHLYSSLNVSISQSGNFTLTQSDHDAIFLVFGKKPIYKNKQGKLIKGRNFKNVDWETLSNELNKLDWQDKCTDIPPAQLLTTFETVLFPILNEIAPFSSKRIKNNNNHWVTSDLLKHINSRNRLLRHAKLTQNPNDMKSYRQSRNKCNLLTKQAKSHYYVTKLTEHKDSKSIWRTCNELLGKRKSTTKIDFMTIDGQLCSDKIKIATCLADAFVPTRDNAEKEIDSLFTSIENVTMTTPYFTLNNVKHAFNHLSDKTNDQKLEIPVIFLKNTSEALMIPLCQIYNKLFEQGIFPDNLKHGTVTPLYKGKGSKYEPLSFRPISVLPFLGKLYEKLLHDKLVQHLEQNKLLDVHQHGFRKGRSCQSALYYVTQEIFNKIDKTNNKVGACFVDLAQAYNYVPHFGLLTALKDEFNVNEHLLKVFCNYLTNRTFSIKLDDFTSTPFALKTGIPQGSILSAIFFICYYNQVFSCLGNVNYCTFADDLIFWCSNTSEIEIFDCLKFTLTNLDSWCTSKLLAINYSKTKIMIFHKSHNKIDNNLVLEYNDTIIEKVSNFKYLGVFLDESMNFIPQFAHLRNKLSSAIGCLNLVRKYITEQVFVILLNCFILSIVDYGLPIWGHSCPSKLIKIQNQINAFIKCYFYPSLSKLHNKKYWANINNKFHSDVTDHKNSIKLSKNIDMNVLLEKCNILSMPERLKYFSIMTVYKTLKYESCVPYFNEMFNLKNCRDTNQLLHVPKFQSNVAQNSVHFWSVKLWNSLPRNLRDIKIEESLPSVFIHDLMTWCMSSRNI